MTPVSPIDTDQETLTLADPDASVGMSPDRTGDFAAGRTHFHPSSEEILACLESQPYERVDS